ncbi:MAG: hypothetical protein ABIO94_12040 [Opitutaceae bacterium]
MKTRSWICGWAFLLAAGGQVFAAAASVTAANRPTVIVVVGASGEDEFEPNFATQAAQWEKVCQLANCQRITIGVGTSPSGTDYDRLKEAFAAEAKESAAELWVVLVGHGTFDGKEAKFNLRGPDVAAAELAAWLKPFQRPLAVIDTASASAPFLAKLSAPNRVIVTSTRSGNEHNFARFGQFFVEAMIDPKSDLDQDGQTSLLETFLTAATRVAEFYKTEGRLATEHALIDDNGDGLGTPSDWFRGTRAVKKAGSGTALDGARARQFHLILSDAEQKLSPDQRAHRDELELAIENLRDRKTRLGDEEYYRRLEILMLELAKVYTPPTVPPGT